MLQTPHAPFPAPVLETERLILRVPQAQDFEAWCDNVADAETMRFLGGVQSRAMAWRNLATVVGAWSITGFSMFSVIEKSTGRWVGRLGPWRPEGWPGNEIGWAIARHAWGQGYATEGAAAAMDYAFEVLGWEEAIHSIDSKNLVSIAVARKLGSDRTGEGWLPDPINKTIDLYGQTRAAWRVRRDAQA